MLKVSNLKKSFASHIVVNDVSFSVEKGEILAILGPNGAGKTTTFKCILGLLTADSGEVKFAGQDLEQQKELLGCTPQESEFPSNLNSSEVLKFVAGHYPNAMSVDEALNSFQIEKFAKQKISSLSGGQRRCLGLACAFIGRPQFVVLDEPTVGLDVEVRQILWAEVDKFVKSGGSVLLTTHYLEEAEQVAQRILVMNRGQIIRQGQISEIKKQLGFNRIRYQQDGLYKEMVTDQSDELVKNIVKQGNFSDLAVAPISLEEAFIEIVKQDEHTKN